MTTTDFATEIDRNKETLRRLLEDVMPNGRFDEIDELVAPGCVTRRAGFADLVAARGIELPAEGTFRERFEAGWQPMSEVLRDQRVEVLESQGQGDTVWVRSRLSFRHSGDFLGAPASGREVECGEVGIARFDRDGRIVELWFMCEELKVAGELGFALTLPTTA